jgi:hypothetical protein
VTLLLLIMFAAVIALAVMLVREALAVSALADECAVLVRESRRRTPPAARR